MKADPIRTTWPRVYPKKAKGRKGWCIDARRMRDKKAVGKQRWRADRTKALELAATIAAEYDDSGSQGIAMPIQLRAMAFQGQQLVQPFGKTILDACQFYAEHLKERQAAAASALVSKLAKEWYAAKASGKTKKLRPETLRGIKQARDILTATFGTRRILDVTTADVRSFLDKQQVSLRRRFNLNALFSQFFNWCIENDHAAKNPCDKITIEVDGKDVEIFTPTEAQKVLDVCVARFPAYTLYHAISLFAGLRPEEAQFLDWKEIDMEQRSIFVLAETSKTKESRHVHIEDTLYEWLMECRPQNPKGYVTPQVNFKNRSLQIHMAAGFRGTTSKKVEGVRKTVVLHPDVRSWPVDVMRHSYGSYWLSSNGNRAQLAENMGNSAKIIKKHYRRAVNRTDTTAFWNILPARVLAAREEEARKADEMFQPGVTSEEDEAEIWRDAQPT